MEWSLGALPPFSKQPYFVWSRKVARSRSQSTYERPFYLYDLQGAPHCDWPNASQCHKPSPRTDHQWGLKPSPSGRFSDWLHRTAAFSSFVLWPWCQPWWGASYEPRILRKPTSFWVYRCYQSWWSSGASPPRIWKATLARPDLHLEPENSSDGVRTTWYLTYIWSKDVDLNSKEWYWTVQYVNDVEYHWHIIRIWGESHTWRCSCGY